MQKNNLRFHAADIYNGKLYFSSNYMSGIYCYDFTEGRNTYCRKKGSYPVGVAFKNRDIYIMDGKLCELPYDGTAYEIYDISTMELIKSIPIGEHRRCMDSCRINELYLFIIEFDRQEKMYFVRVLDLKEMTFLEMNELNLELKNVYSEVNFKRQLEMLASNYDKIWLGCGGTDKYFEIQVKDFSFVCKKITEGKIKKICVYKDKLVILLEDEKLIFISTEDDKKFVLVRNKTDNDREIISIFSCNGKMFALCAYDNRLYRVVHFGENYTMRLAVDNQKIDECFVKYRSFLGHALTGDVLYLFPFNYERLSVIKMDTKADKYECEYRDLLMSEEHLQSYYEGYPYKGNIIEEESQILTIETFLTAVIMGKSKH